MSRILTAAELDALPAGTWIIDRFNDTAVKGADGLWHSPDPGTASLWSAKVAKWKPRLLLGEVS